MKGFLLVALLSAFSAVYASKKVVICYYGTWAVNRPGLGKFGVEDVNPYLCTHIMYAFAGINKDGYILPLDPELDFGKSNYQKFTDLKKKNPDLKTLLAVGGWDEGSAKYSEMAADPAKRQNFILSALDIILDIKFDGLDLDWEYPNRRDTVHGQDDIDNFTQLLKEMREEFDKYDLILTAAVSAVGAAASQSYNISAISTYLHYVNLMSYDLHGAWDTVTGHNAALHKGEGDEGVQREELFTVDVAVEYWLREGCPPEKLVMGVPFYGRSFKLKSENDNGVRAPTDGVGIGGPYTGSEGFLGYNEICALLQSDPLWTIRRDNQAKVPYAFNGLNWVSYDDPESIRTKVEYVLEKNLAGVMMWSIETDDFHNVCGGGKYTLLNVINDALLENSCP